MLTNGTFAPAYADPPTFYQWEGVVVTYDALPRDSPYQRQPRVDVTLSSISVQTVVPELRLRREGNGLSLLGYYDKSRRVFYRWRGLTLTATAAEAAQGSGRIRALSEDEWKMVITTVDIDIPARLWKGW